MAVIALASASGSPGVTTTAVALALGWTRPVLLVEADPTGGSGIHAGFLRGTSEYDGGLIELALSSLGVDDALRDVVRPLAPNVSFVSGLRSHTQIGALRDIWEPLALALSDLESSGQDVIIDAGRLGLDGSPRPLLEAADLTVLITRTDLPSLSAARSWTEVLRHPGAGLSRVGLLLGGKGHPYRASDVTKVLGLPVVSDLPDDPQAAAVYHRGSAPPRRFETGPYVCAVAAAGSSLQAQIARDRFAPVGEGPR